MRLVFGAAAGVLCCALPIQVRGDQVSFSFSGSVPSGHAAAAKFTFDDVAETLTVRIANTIGPGHNAIDSRALTGLFWDMTPGALPIVGVSSTHGGAVNNSLGLSAEQVWAFRGDLSAGATPFGTQFGLGAAGFNVFNAASMLAPGAPGPQPNGLDGGILSATGNAYGGTRQNPLFRSFVEFTFELASPFFSGGLGGIAITGVSWQFGSGFDEPGITVVPLPAGVWAGLTGLAALGAWRTIRRRAAH